MQRTSLRYARSPLTPTVRPLFEHPAACTVNPDTSKNLARCRFWLRQASALISSGPVTVARPADQILLAYLSFVQRQLDLGTLGVHAIETAAPVSAAVLARAALETAAIAHYFATQAVAAPANATAEELNSWLLPVLAGTRFPDASVKAVNVLTHIDRLQKHLPHLRSQYDFLSEIAHPNGLGGTFLLPAGFTLALSPSSPDSPPERFNNAEARTSVIYVSALLLRVALARTVSIGPALLRAPVLLGSLPPTSPTATPFRA